jgi:hypothetical protein
MAPTQDSGVMRGSETFQELSHRLGGFNPKALGSFFYWNNPLELKHWTMNVVEILMLLGAALALAHAIRVYRRTENAAHLCFWFAAVGYMFVAEVPLYFPDLVGGDPNGLFFLHNEFSIGLLYDRAPLYIVALYPALTYPLYVLVEEMGIFRRPWGVVQGSVCVGFAHHCFYEIFDQFGPQYGWWDWNYQMFGAWVASVPLSSMFSFAFVGPFALTFLFRSLISAYILRCTARGDRRTAGGRLIVLTALVSSLTIVIVCILSPETYYRILLSVMPSSGVQKLVSFSLLGMAGIVTMRAFMREGSPVREQGSATVPGHYPQNWLILYLLVFVTLWVYAAAEYIGSANGVTAHDTPTGSLPYVIACFVISALLVHRSRPGGLLRRRPEVAHDIA